MDALIKLADHFGVSIDQLLGRTPPPVPKTIPNEFIETWQKLSPQRQQRVIGFAQSQLENEEQIKKIN